jgi:hypothetical protein
MEICLREIKRRQQTGIKPNFIVRLGERYGADARFRRTSRPRSSSSAKE